MSPNVIKLKDMFSQTVGDRNCKLMLLFNQQQKKNAPNDINKGFIYKMMNAKNNFGSHFIM